jgi:hypothetical protein
MSALLPSVIICLKITSAGSLLEWFISFFHGNRSYEAGQIYILVS